MKSETETRLAAVLTAMSAEMSNLRTEIQALKTAKPVAKPVVKVTKAQAKKLVKEQARTQAQAKRIADGYANSVAYWAANGYTAVKTAESVVVKDKAYAKVLLTDAKGNTRAGALVWGGSRIQPLTTNADGKFVF